MGTPGDLNLSLAAQSTEATSSRQHTPATSALPCMGWRGLLSPTAATDVLVAAILAQCVYRPADEAACLCGELIAQLPAVNAVQLDAIQHAARRPGRPNRYLLATSPGVLYVAIAGTRNRADVATSAKFFLEPVTSLIRDPAGGAAPSVHLGFAARARKIPGHSLLRLAESKHRRLVLCGHSLGGAIACLVALDLLVARPGAAETVSCVVFAAPGVGNATLKAASARWEPCFTNILLPEDLLMSFGLPTPSDHATPAARRLLPWPQFVPLGRTLIAASSGLRLGDNPPATPSAVPSVMQGSTGHRMTTYTQRLVALAHAATLGCGGQAPPYTRVSLATIAPPPTVDAAFFFWPPPASQSGVGPTVPWTPPWTRLPPSAAAPQLLVLIVGSGLDGAEGAITWGGAPGSVPPVGTGSAVDVTQPGRCAFFRSAPPDIATPTVADARVRVVSDWGVASHPVMAHPRPVWVIITQEDADRLLTQVRAVGCDAIAMAAVDAARHFGLGTIDDDPPHTHVSWRRRLATLTAAITGRGAGDCPVVPPPQPPCAVVLRNREEESHPATAAVTAAARRRSIPVIYSGNGDASITAALTEALDSGAREALIALARWHSPDVMRGDSDTLEKRPPPVGPGWRAADTVRRYLARATGSKRRSAGDDDGGLTPQLLVQRALEGAYAGAVVGYLLSSRL